MTSSIRTFSCTRVVRVASLIAKSVCVLAGCTLLALSLLAQQSTTSVPTPAQASSNQSAEVAQQLDRIVGRFRKIIVLMDNDESLDPITRDRVSILGKMLFEQNLEDLSALSVRFSAQPGKIDALAVKAFLNHVESNPDYRDADKLVFRDTFDELASAAGQRSADKQLQKRITEDIAALDQIQAMYEKEMGRVFDRFQTRAMPVHREAWEHYLSFLKQKYQREQILKEYESALPQSETRGGGAAKNHRQQIYGRELPPKTLLLTFDDGPHPMYTARILEILKKYQVQAVFFQVGRNLGSVGKDGTIKLAPGAAIDTQILEEGSALGNHTYTHALLPKLDAPGYNEEIDSTDVLLKSILKTDPVLFRPPYGASNDGILATVQARQLKSMIWNIDSMDWADPVPSSVAQRVLKQVETTGRGIILFHDIHKRAVEILAQLIETLQSEGYSFAAWNGSGFAVNSARGIQVTSLPVPSVAPYRESWAAIVGIDDYQKWPKLRYAAHDAQGVRDLLVQKYKFKPDHIFTLFNQEATRQNILSLLGDKLGNSELVKHDDRVFVFFAGHGATRKLPSGRDLGYIIPVDADLSNYQGQSISMTNFQDIAEAIPAKHVLFVMDSCYSGLALTRGGALTNSQNYLQEIARREARQMFTAGGADQQVSDNGPNGHSVFTWTLLQALDGRGDLNGDGVITASELAAYVAPAVSALSHQTPAFGNLGGSEGGDFIFTLKHESEFLNSDSAQLGDDGIKLNSELERLRAENLARTQENEKLQRELAALKQGKTAATSTTPNTTGSASSTAQDTAPALNDQGMLLYKEKKYTEAANKFIKAAELDPTSALFANNAGFAFYKLQNYEESVAWFKKAIALDANRAVAYINLGDAYGKLQRNAEARQSYEKYLELAPASKSAADVKLKLQALAP